MIAKNLLNIDKSSPVLGEGVGFSIKHFNNSEYRWIYNYAYSCPVHDDNPKLHNNVNLVVNYNEDDKIDKCTFLMQMRTLNINLFNVFLRESILTDIYSFGIFEFVEQDNGILKRIDKHLTEKGEESGCKWDSLENQLKKNTNTANFPLPTELVSKSGFYELPFLKKNNELGHFKFPVDYSDFNLKEVLDEKDYVY